MSFRKLKRHPVFHIKHNCIVHTGIRANLDIVENEYTTDRTEATYCNSSGQCLDKNERISAFAHSCVS